jgi:hypothetical protein
MKGKTGNSGGKKETWGAEREKILKNLKEGLVNWGSIEGLINGPLEMGLIDSSTYDIET